MKENKFNHFFGLTIAAALVIGLFAACTEARDYNLDTPINVQITVVERTMTVTWDAVENAKGYEITTASTGCGSGNRIIDTKNNTATNHAGEGAYIKDDKTNGAVEIKNATTIQITLMPARKDSGEKDEEGNAILINDNTKPMASAVSAKVKALGDDEYIDSEYSSEATKTLGGM